MPHSCILIDANAQNVGVLLAKGIADLEHDRAELAFVVVAEVRRQRIDVFETEQARHREHVHAADRVPLHAVLLRHIE